jgi:hypothetical protein
VVEAVARHHTPSRVESPCFDTTCVIHIANGLLRESSGIGGEGDVSSYLLDRSYLRAAGVSEHLAAWRDVVREVLRGDVERAA